ncbi:MAG: response regulator transcription factor [Ilumatobacter sp.]|uniref:response regulator transcription factor n=1 Tax=Ilumatobacter sp. TaxID=1967498 RepID=UPI003C70648C
MRVLVVDDEEQLRLSLRRGLQADGFAVDVAASGGEGLIRATEGDYDAIVLDLMMPELNGFRVCAELRRREVWTPILVLTAKEGHLDEAEALETGADDYLRKPFSHTVLVARLRALLRRGASRRSPALMAGDLLVDPARRQCRRGNNEIELTAREFSVLEHLMRNAGDVVTKRKLLDGVWDVDYDGDENIVEVYVAHLRKKIDQPFGRGSIETVRGSGYRLREDGG